MLELRVVALDEISLDQNIRADVEIDPAFVDSIKAQGVLQPLIGYVDMLGQLVVHDGQRRFLAARQAGLTQVPVLVGPAPGSDQARILEQFALNEARSGMSIRDKALAVEQLALFGMSPEVIARKVGRPVDEVESLSAIAAASNIKDIVEEVPDLTVVQAATLAELSESEDFSESDLADLQASIQEDSARTDHYLQRAVSEAECARKRRELLRWLDGEGIRHGSDLPTKHVYVSSLKDTDGEPMTPDSHRDCPGNFVWVNKWALDKESLRFLCLNPELHKSAAQLDEERVAAEARARAEGERKARRAAWKAASKVRLAFVQSLLGKLPHGALAWAIRQTLPEGQHGSWGLSNPVALVEGAGVLPQRVSLEGWARMTTKGAHTVLVAGALAAFEGLLKSEPPYYAQVKLRADYLRQLAQWGYVLSEAEEEFLSQAAKSEAQ